MNTMKSFYASIASAPSPQDPYLEALPEIIGINRTQAKALLSNRGWQEWGEQNKEAVSA